MSRPSGIAVATAAALIERVFPQVRWLAPEAAGPLGGRLGVVGIVGGATYDALVGEAARAHGCTLLTRDRRAIRTYDLVGADHEFVGE